MASTTKSSDLYETEYDEIWNARHKLAMERRVEIDEYITKLQQLFKEIDKNVQESTVTPYENAWEAREKRIDLDNSRDSVLMKITKWVERCDEVNYIRPLIVPAPSQPKPKPKQ